MSMPIASQASPSPPITKGRYDDEIWANHARTFNRYKDTIETLPKEKGWRTENVYMYQGFWHQSGRPNSIETLMAIQDTFKAHPNDIYLATMPKSGTTWLKALAFALVKRKEYKTNSLLTHPLLVSNPHTCVPGLPAVHYLGNTTFYADGDSPHLYSTHIPYTSLPQSILDSGCPLVYLCRNPKDVLVSTFHFTNRLRDKHLGQMTFEEAFKSFSKGIMSQGPYWDHVKGYRKASLEHPEKVLFLTYEDMSMDTANVVKRLAKFLGYPFTEREEAEGAVEEIVKLCGFKNLSEVNKHGSAGLGIPNNAFFREGKVGDWKNYLTDEMSRILDEITEEKFHGLDISFPI